MHNTMRVLFAALLAGFPGGSLCSAAFAMDMVVVHVRSGRQFAGHVDKRTDSSQLWLRHQQDSTVLLRPIAWNRVQQASCADQEFDRDSLRELVLNELPTDSADSDDDRPESRAIMLRGSAVDDASYDPSISIPEPQLRSVNYDVQLGNWDGDAETDGLQVAIYPENSARKSVPVSGSLRVELIASVRRDFAAVPHGRGEAVVTLARWSQLIRPQDFDAGAAVVDLPFQAVHPELDHRIAPYGQLRLRLTVPGQGTFDRIVDDIRTRPFRRYW